MWRNMLTIPLTYFIGFVSIYFVHNFFDLVFIFCFWTCWMWLLHRPNKNYHLHAPRGCKYHKSIHLVPEKYIKPPSYCRSLCAGRFMKSSSKTTHKHDRKDGFKKRKKTRKRSEKDLLLLSTYRNKHIPAGTRTLCFILFVTLKSFHAASDSFLLKFWNFCRQSSLQHLWSNSRGIGAGRRRVWRVRYSHGEDSGSSARQALFH